MKYGSLTLGQVEAVVNKLGGLEGVKRFLRGETVLQTIKYIIDLDADPFVPDGWTVEEHQKGGEFEWDQEQVRLYLSDQQKDGKVIKGNELRKELAGQPTFNANLLDYLMEHPELIPEGWKDEYTYFWGTIYRNSDGDLHVRYLYWHGEQWDWHYHWLDNDWYDNDPAAVRAR